MSGAGLAWPKCRCLPGAQTLALRSGSPTAPAGWVPTVVDEEFEAQSSEGGKEEDFCEIPQPRWAGAVSVILKLLHLLEDRNSLLF